MTDRCHSGNTHKFRIRDFNKEATKSFGSVKETCHTRNGFCYTKNFIKVQLPSSQDLPAVE